MQIEGVKELRRFALAEVAGAHDGHLNPRFERGSSPICT